jgi:hypothetical protein
MKATRWIELLGGPFDGKRFAADEATINLGVYRVPLPTIPKLTIYYHNSTVRAEPTKCAIYVKAPGQQQGALVTRFILEE